MHFHIAKNVFFQLLSRITTSAVTFITTVLIASYLGASGFGDYTKIISIVGLFYVLSDFGLNALFLHEPDTKTHFRDLLGLRLILSVLFIVLLFIIAELLPYDRSQALGFSVQVKTGIIIYSLAILLNSILMTSQAIFQKTLSYQKLLFSTIIGSLVGLFLVWISVSHAKPLLTILLSLMVGQAVSALVSLLFTGQSFFPFTIDKKYMKSLLWQSFPLGVMLICNLIYFRIDVVLLSFFKSSHDVGVYGLAYKFFDFLIAIPLFYSNSLYPTFLPASKNFRSTSSNVKAYSIFFTFLSLLIILVFWFAAPLLSLIQKSFTESIFAFRLLLISLPFFFFTSLFQWYLIARKKLKYLVWVYLSIAILNIILNLYFIPLYSYRASAVITGATEGIVCILLFIKTLRIIRTEL